jgi:FkbM family methyltransferase
VTGLDRVDFLTQLISELVSGSQRREFNNTDNIRFPGSSTLGSGIRQKIVGVAVSLGFARATRIDRGRLMQILRTDGLDDAYQLLHDQFSRDLFVRLLAYRILGHHHVRLPLNSKEYWSARNSAQQYIEKRRTINSIPILESLDLFNFKGIRLHCHVLNVLNTFLLEQYCCRRADIGVKPGDVVIDAGGCWGDTALYFARHASQVFCFECIPSNIKIIGENLGMNPALSGRIHVIQKALCGQAQGRLMFKDTGPGSRPNADVGEVEVETETLDHFVSANSLERVSFIKMDIEGSEPDALAGAEQTIRKHRPQLAISIYHDLEHFASIPRWIAELNLGYRMYLDHFTIHEEETILFARSDG